MNFLIKLILSSLAVIVSSYLLPGAHVDGFFDAFVVSLFLALFSATLKPLLIILTIPVTIFTFRVLPIGNQRFNDNVSRLCSGWFLHQWLLVGINIWRDTRNRK